MPDPCWAERRKPRENQQCRPGRAAQVLVVDDDPDLCALLETSLIALAGYEVHVAHGVGQALEAMADQPAPFDGVFLDIQMPGTSGIDLCSILRSTPGYRDVPVIMLTAMGERKYLHEAFARGASDYIAKPFDMIELRDRFSRERMKEHDRSRLRAAPPLPGERSAMNTGEIIRDLGDAVAPPGVARCITREAFDNFVQTTAARHEEGCFVRATKIARAFDLYTGLPSESYQAAVQWIAGALSEETAASSDILTHCGNGVFLSLSFGKSALDRDSLSARLRASRELSRLTAPPHRLRLVVGREVALGPRAAGGVHGAIEAAVDAAEDTEQRSFGWHSFREWRSVRKSLGQEQPRVQQTAYKTLLNDFLRTESGPAGTELPRSGWSDRLRGLRRR